MEYETFLALWRAPVSSSKRNQVTDFETYRDAFLWLMECRRPHFACLTVPTYLQPVLITYFLHGHQMYVRPASEGFVHMTIWHAARPPHRPPSAEAADTDASTDAGFSPGLEGGGPPLH